MEGYEKSLEELAEKYGRFEGSDLFGLVGINSASPIINRIDREIRTIPGHPHKDSIYRDFSTLWLNQAAFRESVLAMYILATSSEICVMDKIVAIEAKGWIYGAILADRLNLPLVVARKHGLLPAGTASKEYGHHDEMLRIHRDAISKGDKVLIVDDLIISGESTRAAAYCVEALGGEVVKIIALADLDEREGKKLLKEEGYNVLTVITYPGQ